MATKDKAVKYDESNIKNLAGREAVRAKPGMYIGGTDVYAAFSCLRELGDNTVDEALAGRNKFCQLHFDVKANTYWCFDRGQGIPVKDIKVKDQVSGETHTLPAIKAIFTLLHTGGKFDDKAYTVARGSHGIGSKATNFLAAEFEVWTFRDGKWWHMLFKEGKVVTDLEKVKAGPTNPYTGKVTESGTVIRFIPDPKIFSKRTIPLNYATEWASIAAYFTSDFKVILSTTDKGHKVYHFPAGPKQYVTDRVAKLGCTALSPDVFTLGNALMDCVVQFTDYGSNDLRGFTNGLNNPDGGVHVRAFMAALKKVLTPYAKKRQEFTVKELEEGLVGIVNAKLSAPRFSSQTKEKLVDERAGEPVQELLLPALKKFFASNKSLAEKLCTRAAQLKSLKEGFQLSKNALKELKKVASRLPAKAATCPKAKPEERELVIVEGDSAAGSVRSARDIRYQEMFPLKGKILNALKHTPEKMLESEEVKGILAMLGYDPKQANPYDKLRVGKIICLADPDPDGPLHGDTQVDVFADEMWQTLTMRELASPAWRNREYQVVTWDGGRFILSEAHNCRVTEVSTKAVSLVFDDGTKITCSPNHQFPLYTQKYDQRVQQQLNNGMLMLRADKLKTGDRICATPIGIDSNGIEGATVPLSFKTVVKCKDHKVDTTQWYCLTVPVYHNFRLASGLMSKNCHINSLLLTLFYRYLPDLFKRGMVYVAETSLFYAYKDKQLVGGDTPEEVEAKLKKLGLKAPVHHCKGYGEVDAHVLRAMAFDPATRKLSRIIPTKGSNGAVEFQKLMSEGTEARKELLGI